ncbi:hypothetical protein CERSUDRAFT_88340 [Gelatoporia subvermispora B]|uniref:Uncharacterized protein n=1 Tax=Ceriporiopsis subvermispora (strain B) TaxID=914234 RepID=M2R1B5_CERS8|nr:hypothetical protein CERSUDRAFT_88340 [Gelatoporia subvermispora B]
MSYGAGTASSPALPPLNTGFSVASTYTPRPIISPAEASASLSPTSPRSFQSGSSTGPLPPPRQPASATRTGRELTSVASVFVNAMTFYGQGHAELSGSPVPSEHSNSSDSGDINEEESQGDVGSNQSSSYHTFGANTPVNDLRRQVFGKFNQLENGILDGFAAVDRRFDKMEKTTNERFNEVDQKIEALKVEIEAMIHDQIQQLLKQLTPMLRQPPELPEPHANSDVDQTPLSPLSPMTASSVPTSPTIPDVGDQQVIDRSFLNAVEAVESHMQAAATEQQQARSAMKTIRHKLSTMTIRKKKGTANN